MPVPAVDGQHVEALQMARVRLHRLGDLDRELARRRQHEQLRLGASLRSMRHSSGSANAAVLPVPVCAWPSTSRPSSSGGIAASWIGDGVS